MQISSTISEIHLKNTHFTYTVAAPAPQNTPDCGNRVNTPASVKCCQVSPNSSLIHYVKLYISIHCIYTQARTHRPYKRDKKPFGNLSWVRVMSHFALCSNSIQNWFELYMLIYKKYYRFAGPLSACGKRVLNKYFFWFHRIYVRNR